MAIDSSGQVTTTGLMGGKTKLPAAPDMSGLKVNTPNGTAYGVIKGNTISVYFGKTAKMGVWLDGDIYWVDNTRWYYIL